MKQSRINALGCRKISFMHRKLFQTFVNYSLTRQNFRYPFDCGVQTFLDY